MLKHLLLLKIQNLMDIDMELLQGFIYFLIKKLLIKCIKNENISNKELAEELNIPIIKRFKKRKVQSPFIGNMWVPDLAHVQLINN